MVTIMLFEMGGQKYLTSAINNLRQGQQFVIPNYLELWDKELLTR